MHQDLELCDESSSIIDKTQGHKNGQSIGPKERGQHNTDRESG